MNINILERINDIAFGSIITSGSTMIVSLIVALIDATFFDIAFDICLVMAIPFAIAVVVDLLVIDNITKWCLTQLKDLAE